MPLLSVKVMEGVFIPKQRQQMIGKFTDTKVSIEGENMRPLTLVIVEEVKSGDRGVGGNGCTTTDVKAVAVCKLEG